MARDVNPEGRRSNRDRFGMSGEEALDFMEINGKPARQVLQEIRNRDRQQRQQKSDRLDD